MENKLYIEDIRLANRLLEEKIDFRINENPKSDEGVCTISILVQGYKLDVGYDTNSYLFEDLENQETGQEYRFHTLDEVVAFIEDYLYNL